MLYNPSLLPYSDVIILILNSIILYFILRMEKINCLPNNDWRPIYLKNYTIANVIITTLSMLVSVNKWNLMLYTLFRLPLHIFLLYVVYVYTRDLESNFSTCNLRQSDKNIHEFLKFYSLLQVCLILLVIAITLSILFAHFPRYTSMMKLFTKYKK
jgi:hypothetical protein